MSSSSPASTAESVSVALLVRLEAKPGHEDDVETFLKEGLAVVLEEPQTIHWFATRLGPSSFGIFDTFPGEEGRTAHLTGRVAAALMARAGDMLASPPAIEKVDILATKAPSSAAPETQKALLVRLEAKAGQESNVEAFLKGGLAIVRDEPATIHWYALRLGPTTFGIFDTFPGEEGRDAHLSGRVAAALMASAKDLLASAPEIGKVDLLAVKP